MHRFQVVDQHYKLDVASRRLGSHGIRIAGSAQSTSSEFFSGLESSEAVIGGMYARI